MKGGGKFQVELVAYKRMRWLSICYRGAEVLWIRYINL